MVYGIINNDYYPIVNNNHSTIYEFFFYSWTKRCPTYQSYTTDALWQQIDLNSIPVNPITIEVVMGPELVLLNVVVSKPAIE